VFASSVPVTSGKPRWRSVRQRPRPASSGSAREATTTLHHRRYLQQLLFTTSRGYRRWPLRRARTECALAAATLARLESATGGAASNASLPDSPPRLRQWGFRANDGGQTPPLSPEAKAWVDYRVSARGASVSRKCLGARAETTRRRCTCALIDIETVMALSAIKTGRKRHIYDQNADHYQTNFDCPATSFCAAEVFPWLGDTLGFAPHRGDPPSRSRAPSLGDGCRPASAVFAVFDRTSHRRGVVAQSFGDRGPPRRWRWSSHPQFVLLSSTAISTVCREPFILACFSRIDRAMLMAACGRGRLLARGSVLWLAMLSPGNSSFA